MRGHRAVKSNPVSMLSVSTRATKMLYRAEEAAEIMSLSRTAIYGLIRSGDLDTIKIGNRRRIPRSSIEDYVARQMAGQVIPDRTF